MTVTRALYQETVTSALRRRFSGLRNGADLLAEMAEVTTRTARNWLDGHNAPQGAALIRLEALCSEVATATDGLRRIARGEDV